MTGNDDGRRSEEKIWGHIGGFIERFSTWIIITMILLTVLLVFPIVLMEPDARARDNPGGGVFDLTERIEEEMPTSDMYASFIIEARDGDMLTQKSLYELYLNEEELRNSDLGSEYLYYRFDMEANTTIFGLYSLADAVQQVLINGFNTGLENATDDHVKLAVHLIFQDENQSGLKDTLSVKAGYEEGLLLGVLAQIWTSPAIMMGVISDNNKIINQYSKTLDGNNTDEIVREYYNREIQEILRGEQDSYRLWGIAIDVNLEAEDEGKLSVPLIAAAVVLILIIVAIQFRSPTVMGLTFIGIIMLIIWIMGLSNLIGLKSSLTKDIIVPVAILVLGVDYVIHSMHRFNEEKKKGSPPKEALSKGIGGVGGALFLAMITTVVAFASNAISDIETIREFGIASSMAIVAAFLIMGIFLPVVKMRIDHIINERNKKKGKEVKKKSADKPTVLSKTVLAVADRRMIVIPVILLISLGSVYFAFQLEARLDVKEYFSSDSDFVISLDKVDEHVGEKGGERAMIYLEGNLTRPEVLHAIKDMESSMENNENIARNPEDGKVIIYYDIFELLDTVFRYPYARNAIENSTGVRIEADPSDGIPDTAEQNRAIFSYIHENGIPINETILVFEPSRVRERFSIKGDGIYSTVVMTGIPGTREQSVMGESRVELMEDMEILDIEGITYAGLTGPGYERDETLNAITDSLSLSIIVAVVLCFLVLLIMFRSFKFSIVTVIPEILVATWLYALMFIAGYHLNAVTATIAAISIGVGIDYSVHITERYRQELAKGVDRRTAMELTARHSGMALTGSAASTMFGFAIIFFAPMPMFSSFGILTALMILMAFIAALIVLPSLLIMVTKDGNK